MNYMTNGKYTAHYRHLLHAPDLEDTPSLHTCIHVETHKITNLVYTHISHQHICSSIHITLSHFWRHIHIGLMNIQKHNKHLHTTNRQTRNLSSWPHISHIHIPYHPPNPMFHSQLPTLHMLSKSVHVCVSQLSNWFICLTRHTCTHTCSPTGCCCQVNHIWEKPFGTRTSKIDVPLRMMPLNSNLCEAGWMKHPYVSNWSCSVARSS